MLFKKSGLCSHFKHLLTAIGHLVEVLISVVNINKCMSQILYGKVANEVTWVCLTGIISCLNSLNVNVEGSCRPFSFFLFFF